MASIDRSRLDPPDEPTTAGGREGGSMRQRHDEKKAMIAAAVRQTRAWLDPRRLVMSLIVVAAGATLLVILAVAGLLGAAYDRVTTVTTDGRPWTHIMRDHPWIFWVFFPLVLAGLWWVTPRHASGRLWVATAAFLAGFLGGHVFW